MIIRLDIKDFDVQFNSKTEEFYIDLCDFKYAICAEIEFAGVIESSIKFEFTGELEREEVQAICTADLSRWRTEKGKIIFNTSIYLD